MQCEAGFRLAVEAAEDRHAEIVVDDPLFADQLAVAIIFLDAAGERAFQQGVGKAIAG